MDASTLVVVETTVDRLKARYAMLDKIGLGLAQEQRKLHQGASSKSILMSSIRAPVQNSISSFMQEAQRAASSNTTNHGAGGANCAQSGAARPSDQKYAPNADQSEQTAKSKAPQPPGGRTNGWTGQADHDNEADRQRLVEQVMKDFGFRFQNGAARSVLHQDPFASVPGQHQPMPGSEPKVHPEFQASCHRDAFHENTLRNGGGAIDSSAIQPNSFVASTLVDATTASNDKNYPNNSYSNGGQFDDEDLPRPSTPPRQHQRHTPQYADQQAVTHQPDVLVVSGFDDAEAPRAQRPATHSDCIGAPTFSTTAISELVALANQNLSSSKRDEIFSVAQRAFEGYVGQKGSAPTALYENASNVCRDSEKISQSSLKSIDEIFTSIVGLTARAHRQGTLVADERSKHRRLLVPGGCSKIVSDVISKHLGKSASLLQVIPREKAVNGNTANGSPSDVGHVRGKSASPTRKGRVLSNPFLTQTLPRNQKMVRHASATRRTNSVAGMPLHSAAQGRAMSSTRRQRGEYF